MPDENTDDQISDGLADSIEGAKPETLSTAAPTTDEEDERDFGDIVEGVAEGDISPEELEEILVGWANDRLDVPFVPEALEGQLLGLAVDLLTTAIVEAATSLA